ncbi:MAG: hypothetical protein B6D55_04095 [Candidatus Omnitrophica bacterium 4484_70.2]|nr:MAG: hypothetical protein B6D55_04095 [Candidatus Omnitrophica bacterium 4484_70.2]
MSSSIDIGEVALSIIFGFIGLFSLYCIIYKRKILGETETVKYKYGYPNFEDSNVNEKLKQEILGAKDELLLSSKNE